MKIKEIKDPKIQQMAVLNAIEQHPEYELGIIMEYELLKLFTWGITQQGYQFWWKLDMEKPVNYTDKGLYFKNEFGDILLSEKEILFVFGFILATPEEVFDYLNPKRMEHEPMKGEELEALKIEKDKMINKEIGLVQQRDELNDLVDLIYNETLSIKLMNEIVSNIHNMISRFRTPSIVGTTQTIEIDGKKYEVTINKEI